MDEAIASGQLDGRAVLQDSGVFRAPGEPLRTPVAAFTTSEDGPTLRTPPPRFGEHNNAVLGELGFSVDEIERFADQGVI